MSNKQNFRYHQRQQSNTQENVKSIFLHCLSIYLPFIKHFIRCPLSNTTNN